MGKLLHTGKTDLLDKFISNRTRRPFSARLAWSADEGKVIFEFEPRENGRTAPRRTTASASAKTATRTTSKSTQRSAAQPKTPRAGSLRPSPALATIIDKGPYGRGEVMQKIWEYIKAHNLQDPKDKRILLTDDKLRPLFEADQLGMFKLAGVIAKHLS